MTVDQLPIGAGAPDPASIGTHPRRYPLNAPSYSWCLRSARDHDTHKATPSAPGMVAALCGVSFRPVPLLLGEHFLPEAPADARQICADCAAKQ